jgi:hypothetical protein
MKTTTFEEFLQEIFMNLREIGGMPITKDNYEDLYSSWCEQLDVQELIDYAEFYGRKCRIEGKEEILKNFEKPIQELDTAIFATHIEKDELTNLKDIIKTNLMEMLGKSNDFNKKCKCGNDLIIEDGSEDTCDHCK